MGTQESAQRCVTAYLRSVFLAPNRAVFDVNKLPIAEYASSMGLSAPPKLRFVKRAGKATQEVLPHIPLNCPELLHFLTLEGPIQAEDDIMPLQRMPWRNDGDRLKRRCVATGEYWRARLGGLSA